ncbi:MAG: hypothetical protein QJR07_10780, partial [Acetobacteraceae bacterium]|nr:hypothetical protein [Acetobacteraceae bacterium]
MQRLLRIEARPQQDLIAQADVHQQVAGEGVDVEQRQHADDAAESLLSFRPEAAVPQFILAACRRQVGMGQHRPLGQPGGAAGILQQRHVIFRNLRQRARIRRPHPGFQPLHPLRHRGGGRSLPPMRIVPHHQAGDEALCPKGVGQLQQPLMRQSHEHPRAGIAQLVRDG